MNTQYKWLLILFIFGFIACEDDDDGQVMEEVVITSGEADFSTFVSLGNSLTAGFTDNALFILGQENSMPNILAQQFALAGGGNFVQPLMSDNVGGALLGGNQILGPRLIFDATAGGPVPVEWNTYLPKFRQCAFWSSFNNMGVPGAKSFHLVAPGYGDIAGLGSYAGNCKPLFCENGFQSNDYGFGRCNGTKSNIFLFMDRK